MKPFHTINLTLPYNCNYSTQANEGNTGQSSPTYQSSMPAFIVTPNCPPQSVILEPSCPNPPPLYVSPAPILFNDTSKKPPNLKVNSCNTPQKSKSKWTPEEDQKLIDAVNLYGTDSWIRVAMQVPGRNSKQCRERWMGQLSPKIVKTNWTLEEDQILIQQHQAIGNKWTTIAKVLPGRSAINIKNRWSRLKRQPAASFQASLKPPTIPHIPVAEKEQYPPQPSIPFSSTVSLVPKQPNVIFELPAYTHQIFGPDFVRFQENMLNL